MTEPVVTLTDFLLSAECAFVTWRLWKKGGQKTAQLLFGSLAVGAWAGGMTHGFALQEGTEANWFFWKLTLLMIGFTTLALWQVGLSLVSRLEWSRAVGVVAAVQWVGYTLYVLAASPPFIFVIANYFPSTVFLFFAAAWARHVNPDYRDAKFILSGVVLTWVAAAAQALRWSLHPVYFNHNCVYHTIQIVAVYLMYLGFKGMPKVTSAEPADSR